MRGLPANPGFEAGVERSMPMALQIPSRSTTSKDHPVLRATSCASAAAVQS